MNTSTTVNNTLNVLSARNNWNKESLRTNLIKLYKENPTQAVGDLFKTFTNMFNQELININKTYLNSGTTVQLFKSSIPTADELSVEIKEEVTMKEEVTKRLVQVFTDGSCDVHDESKPGGWGVYLVCGTKTKELFGFETETTNNLMELQAMEQAILSVDTSRPDDFDYQFITDSKYVLRTMVNKEKYEAKSYKKVSNIEAVKSLYNALESKGIVIETFLTYAEEKNMNSGDVYATANSGSISFIWERGHSDDGGNDKADKLAVKARKGGFKAPDVTADLVVPEEVAEPSAARTLAAQLLGMNTPTPEEVVEPVAEEINVAELVASATTFNDIVAILEASDTLELGATCSEDFSYYTEVLHNGVKVMEIYTPENKVAEAGYIKDALNTITPLLIEEGLMA